MTADVLLKYLLSFQKPGAHPKVAALHCSIFPLIPTGPKLEAVLKISENSQQL